jgi:benzoate/toluate 1,2-dioxygenase beta subunit
VSALLGADEQREVEVFLYEEARALDERRFDDWLALFDEDGLYWVPASPGEAAPGAALSLFHERKPLLALRVKRLAEPTMHVHSPPARTHHHVSAVVARRAAAPGAAYDAHSSLVVAEWRRGEARWFAGRAAHRLGRAADGTLRIVEKRVDLIDCDAPHRALAIPF